MITPTKVGTYPVICTELCGLGHALMRTTAIVMEPAAFDAWLKQQGKAANGPPGQAGKAVFDNNGCASCHTLKAAGATGKVGPDLDKLPAYAKQAGKPLEDFVKESIVDPNAYVQPGFPKGVMPPFDASRRPARRSGSVPDRLEQRGQMTATTLDAARPGGRPAAHAPERPAARRLDPRGLDDVPLLGHRPRDVLVFRWWGRLGAALQVGGDHGRLDADRGADRLPRRPRRRSTTGSATRSGPRPSPRTIRRTAGAPGPTTSARTPTTR